MFPLLEIGLELKKLHYRFNPLVVGANSEKTHEVAPQERNQAEDLQDLFWIGPSHLHCHFSRVDHATDFDLHEEGRRFTISNFWKIQQRLELPKEVLDWLLNL